MQWGKGRRARSEELGRRDKGQRVKGQYVGSRVQ